jgi:hypothetical protein
LDSLVEQFFTPKSFDSNYPLFSKTDDVEVLMMPEAIKTA